jgi:hypothetical protein
MRFVEYATGAVLVSLICLNAQGKGADEIAGTWRGESACVAKDTACHDERVVYRFASLPAKPGYFSATADKIVDGNAVRMGTLEFRYNDDERELTCKYAQGIWRLKVNGDSMDGTLTRADNTVFRRVTLRRERSHSAGPRLCAHSWLVLQR